MARGEGGTHATVNRCGAEDCVGTSRTSVWETGVRASMSASEKGVLAPLDTETHARHSPVNAARLVDSVSGLFKGRAERLPPSNNYANGLLALKL